ncbi:hypothetical protein I4U23_000472 [Adineta vaga]|nr:hypothetical protein I4U23_000472 [Adineta vaga]
MVLPSSINSNTTHILHIRIRNSSIETIVNEKQLNFIEKQLQLKKITYQRIEDEHNSITMIIGPFLKLTNSSISFNVTKQMILKNDLDNQTTIRIDLNEGRSTSDQESYDFRHCLELCEIYEDEEFKPDHNCIRRKCLEDITGI